MFDYNLLKNEAHKLRVNTFNSFIEKGEAHVGGSFSIIETLIFLYKVLLKKNDKFILSKSHASFPLCIILRELGFNVPVSTHLEIDQKNGIHCTTGSLGHGLPISVGMALSKKKLKKKGRIYVMISDGECQEGTTWESLLIAAKHNLSNLILIIDYNKIQALSFLDDALPLSNLKSKINSFNWNCVQVKNGHSFQNLNKVFTTLPKNQKPTAVIINTIKSKGIKEFENDPAWHAKKLEGNLIEKGMKALKIK
jgi:transketolase